jgi:adenylate cyclase
MPDEARGGPEQDVSPAGSDVALASAADLFRGLRHALRTPINHIIGYSELLLEVAEEEGHAAIVRDLERIRAAGKMLLSLVNESLDAASLPPGRPDLGLLSQALRTPLNAVVGYSDLLQEEAEVAGYAELVPDLQRIETAGKHLLGLVLAEPSPAAGTRASVSGDALGPASARGSLLVVDDDEANRDMLARRLARLGYTVALAENGRVALDRIAAQPFDLVLLDIMMPELDGYGVLRRLKSDDALRHIPVIVLSASDEAESAVRCIELGAEDYLPKPFDSVLLRARIGASLEKKRLRDQEVVYLQQIEAEKRRADELLHVILPDSVVEELKGTNGVESRRYDNVAVLFCDIVGFTAFCDRWPPHEVMPHLQSLVVAYEEIALRHDLQKIKTIGDSFMAAAGLLRPVDDPVLRCIRGGLEMIAEARGLPTGWSVRVGINVGPVVAGLLGQRQYLFDVFGDTVNTAARVESLGIPNAITLSEEAWRQVADRCRGRSLGRLEVKGKGRLELFQFEAFRAH